MIRKTACEPGTQRFIAKTALFFPHHGKKAHWYMSLNVTIPDTFNGPLDLLLHLIRRDEMDIYDIPIAKLAASYLEEIEKMEFVNVDEGAEFLDLASRLLEIKSRMLIPPEERLEEGEDEEDDFDPRTGLVEALLEYRRFKDAARLLGDMAEEQARRYPRQAPRMDFRFVEQAAEEANSLDLLAAFQSMLDRMLPEADAPDVIASQEISISTRIEQIEIVLEEIEKTRFSLLLSGKPNRREMVGFFIAVLELIRRGHLIARQTADFSDIILERRQPPKGAAETTGARTSARRTTWCFPVVRSLTRAAKAKKIRTAGACAQFPAAVAAPRKIGVKRKAAATKLFPASFVGRIGAK